MLQNAYLLAKIGADTAENERNFAENLPKIGNYPGRLELELGVLDASFSRLRAASPAGQEREEAHQDLEQSASLAIQI